MKDKKAYLITAKGDVNEITPANGKDFSLKEMQGYVGGLIEFVRPLANASDKYFLIVNEEGKLEELELNEIATALYGRVDDVIVGDVVLTHTSFVK